MTEIQNPFPSIRAPSPPQKVNKDFSITRKNFFNLTDLSQPESTDRTSTDIGLARTFLFKRNTNFSKKEALKQSCISPKEIISNVNQTFDYIKSNSGSRKGSFKLRNKKIYDTMSRFKDYQLRSSKITPNNSKDDLTNKKLKKFMSQTAGNAQPRHFSQVKEMNVLLSQNKNLNENYLFKNVIKEIKFYYPDKFALVSEYFKSNSEIINSEQKEVKMFNIILEVVMQLIESEEKIEISLAIYDALFEDFSSHLASNSLHRSEFITKLWNFKQEKYEIKISEMKAEINDIGLKKESLNEIKYKNEESIKRLELQVKNQIKIIEKLKKENLSLGNAIEDKDNSIQELSLTVTQLNHELDKKINSYNDLLNRYNSRYKLANNFHYKKSTETKPEVLSLRLGSEENETNSIYTVNDLGSKKSSNTNIQKSTNNSTVENTTTFRRRPNNFKTVIQRVVPAAIFKSSLKKEILHKNSTIQDEEKNSSSENESSMLSIKSSHSSNSAEKEEFVINNINTKKINSVFSTSNLKFASSLKNKIKHTTLLITEQKKITKEEIDHNNIFTSNFDFKRHYSRKEAVKAELQDEGQINDLNLYKNKGVDTTKRKEIGTQTEITSMTVDIDSDNLIAVIKEIIPTHPQIVNRIQNFFSEYDFIYKQSNNLKSKIETIEDNNEHIIETYTNIFSTFVENIKNLNNKIKKFFNDNINKIKEEKFIFDFLNELIDLNIQTVDSNKVSSIYDFISKPDLEKIKNDMIEIDNTKEGTIRKTKTNMTTYGKFNFEGIFKEFFSTSLSNIKLNYSLKKIVKIIHEIYFDMIDNVYFKKDNLHFNKEERFIDFGEVVYFYFVKNFGIEQLVKKKYFAFIKTLFEYEKTNKKISTFLKLLQINKFSNRTKLTRRHSANVPSTFSYEKKYFSVFVSRQILLLIQFLKINNYILKFYEEPTATSHIYIIYPKLYDSILLFFSKLSIHDDIKRIIQDFIEKNKILINKSVHSVIDFDDFIDMISMLLIQYELNYSKQLKVIYNAMLLDKEKEINQFDFVVINEFVLSHRLSYTLIDKMFATFQNKQGGLSFESFESFIMELDCFDNENFKNSYRNMQLNQIQNVLSGLQKEIQGGQMSIFDQMIRRVENLAFKEIGKIVKEKIKNYQERIIKMKKEEFSYENMISIDLFDKITKYLYNQNKTLKFFSPLEYFYTLIEDYKPESENYIMCYINQQKYFKL